MVRVEHDPLERLLTEPLGLEAGVTVNRTLPVPWRGEVDLHGGARQAVEEIDEVAGVALVGEVVSFALDDVRGEVRWRFGAGVGVEEPGVADEDAADDRVLAWRDRPVGADGVAHLLNAAGAV